MDRVVLLMVQGDCFMGGSSGGSGGGYTRPYYSCSKGHGSYSSYCSQCGGRVYRDDQVLVCKRCAHKASSGKFCEDCGGRLEETTIRSYPDPTASSTLGDGSLSWSITCSNCGAAGSEHSKHKYCRTCGNRSWKKVSTSFWKCGACSNELNGECRYCPACGSSMKETYRTGSL